MEIPNQTITTPVAKAQVIIKDYITGRDREYISAALKAVKLTPQMVGNATRMQGNQLDAGEMMTESTHREYEKFIISVNGSKENIVEAVLNLPEEDTTFIDAAILERTPKKKAAEPKA